MTRDLQQRLDGYWSARAVSYAADQHRPQRDRSDQAMWRRIWSAALPAPPAQVVDIGTGSGYVARLLHGLGYDVTGVDSAAGMLDEARRRGAGPRYVLGDALAPPVTPGSVDVVTARYVLWTMRDPEAAVRAWRDLLRPAGRLVLVDGLWFPDGLPGPDDDGVPAGFGSAYGDGAPPLAQSDDIEDHVRVVRMAGLTDVRVDLLQEVLDADRRGGVPAGHRVTPQYLIRGTAPG